MRCSSAISNPVSRVVGIDVEREKIKLFTMMGFLAAIAAIFQTLEVKNYFGNQGQGYLLIAIASVLIGGTSIFGGRATIIGTVFGCFIIAIVEPGLVATGLHGSVGEHGARPHLSHLDYLLSPHRRASSTRRVLRAARWGARFGRRRLGREANGICGAWPEIGQNKNVRKRMSTIKIFWRQPH